MHIEGRHGFAARYRLARQIGHGRMGQIPYTPEIEDLILGELKSGRTPDTDDPETLRGGSSPEIELIGRRGTDHAEEGAAVQKKLRIHTIDLGCDRRPHVGHRDREIDHFGKRAFCGCTQGRDRKTYEHQRRQGTPVR